MRVQLTFMKFDPYPQRADLTVGHRLGEVVSEEGQWWVVKDDHGETHRIHSETLQAEAECPADGRWVVRNPVPTYSEGEQVDLAWMHRNRSRGVPERPDRTGRVVEESGERIVVEDIKGERHDIMRVNGHPERKNRSDAGWVVVGRRNGLPI